MRELRGGAFINTFTRRPRLLIGVAVGLVAFIALPASIREATGALIGWNAGVLTFIAMIAHLMATSRGDAIRAHAVQEDERPTALLLIAVIAAAAALTAIVWELGPVKDMKGANKALHLGLVALTILGTWTFTHLMFALHYAAHYFVADGSD